MQFYATLAYLLLNQRSTKWVESPPWGRYWLARGRKNKGGDRGGKQHKEVENAQPLIDHW